MTTKPANTRTRRVWYGRGNSRLVLEDPQAPPPADVIDEAIALFRPIHPTASTSNHRAGDNHTLPSSLIASLTAQLDALDRQREQLARFLRDVDGIAAEK